MESIAKAQITRAKGNGILGDAGEIQVNISSVTAVDGTQVILSGGTLTDEGKSKLIVLIFFCFLIKGGQGELPAGMSCNPVVAGNTTINVN